MQTAIAHLVVDVGGGAVVRISDVVAQGISHWKSTGECSSGGRRQEPTVKFVLARFDIDPKKTVNGATDRAAS